MKLKLFPGFSHARICAYTASWKDGEAEGGGGGTQTIEVVPESSNEQQEAPKENEPKAPIHQTEEDVSNSLKELYKKSDAKLGDESTYDRKAEKFKTKKGEKAQEKPQEPKVESPKSPLANLLNLNPKAEVKETKVEGQDELDAIAPKKGTDMEGWNALKTKSRAMIEAERNKASTLEKTLGELKTQNEKRIQELEAQVKELGGYRYAVDIYADPDFQSKFIKPMDTQKASIAQILKQFGAKDDDIGTKEDPFSKVPWGDAAQMEAVIEAVEKQNKTQGGILRSKYQRVLEIQNDMQAEVSSARQNHSELTKQRQTEAQARKAQAGTRIETQLKSLSEKKDAKGQLEYPFLSEKKIPEGITEEEKKRLEAENEVARESQKQIRYLASLEEPESRVALAAGAVYAELVQRAYNELYAMHQQVLETMKKVGAAEPGSGNRRPQAQNLNPSPKPPLPIGASVEDSMKHYLGRDR